MTEKDEMESIEREKKSMTSSSLKKRFVDAGDIKENQRKLQQAKAKANNDDETPAIKIESQHIITEWRPAKLLCKRFNIRDPYSHLPDVDPEASVKPSSKDADSILNEMLPLGPAGPSGPSGPSNRNIPAMKETSVEIGKIMKEFSDPLQNVKKADVDLFDELFS